MVDVREITECRSCGSKVLVPVLDLGTISVSDFVLPGESCDEAPLELVQCLDCSLLQLRHTVDRDRIYKNTYWYRSGTNESMRRALANVVSDVMNHANTVSGDTVVDLGCNDGTMLQMFPDWLEKIGIDPSPVIEEAPEGMQLIQDYFPTDYAVPRAKIICSIAQFYNVDNIEAYMKGIDALLAPDGVWCVQMAYLPTTLATLNVGDFCHEHVTFWTVAAFEHLIRRYGMHIAALSFNDVNGGSFRVIVKRGKGYPVAGDSVTPEEMAQFANEVKVLKTQTLDFLAKCRDEGKLVLGLGASTKNNVVLNYYGIGPELIPCFTERQLNKLGRLTSTGIPIISEEAARYLNPAYFFLGPWHFLDSLCERERRYLQGGGKFIVPFPKLRIVSYQDILCAA